MINLLLSLYNFDEDWCYESLKDIIISEHKVLVVPFSYDDNWLNNELDWNKYFNSKNGTHYQEIVNPFKRYGIVEDNINWLNQFIDSIDCMKNKIEESDIIFFTGGYPDKMMDKFKKYNLVKEFEKFDNIIIGSSAGAMVQIKEFHISKDQDYSEYSYCTGLDIINSFDIEVHFTNTENQNISILRAITEKKKPVYSISNNGAILVIDKKIYLLGETIKWIVPEHCYYTI
ncbi:MAG: Type 1 glutamine amidotransferase-like domain-containing protein [Peptostreptococcaceae bacterium]